MMRTYCTVFPSAYDVYADIFYLTSRYLLQGNMFDYSKHTCHWEELRVIGVSFCNAVLSS